MPVIGAIAGGLDFSTWAGKRAARHAIANSTRGDIGRRG